MHVIVCVWASVGLYYFVCGPLAWSLCFMLMLHFWTLAAAAATAVHFRPIRSFLSPQDLASKLLDRHSVFQATATALETRAAAHVCPALAPLNRSHTYLCRSMFSARARSDWVLVCISLCRSFALLISSRVFFAAFSQLLLLLVVVVVSRVCYVIVRWNLRALLFSNYTRNEYKNGISHSVFCFHIFFLLSVFFYFVSAFVRSLGCFCFVFHFFSVSIEKYRIWDEYVRIYRVDIHLWAERAQALGPQHFNAPLMSRVRFENRFILFSSCLLHVLHALRTFPSYRSYGIYHTYSFAIFFFSSSFNAHLAVLISLKTDAKPYNFILLFCNFNKCA